MIKRIYLDLDGVIVNWTKAAITLCGIDPEDPKVTQALIREYDAIDQLVGWPVLAKHINAAGTAYWTDLEFLPWGTELVKYATEVVGKDNVVFVTSPGRFPWAPTGKFMWKEKHFPDYQMVITKAKHLLGKPDSILIDDDVRQTAAFKEAGGKIFTWPSQYSIRNTGVEPVLAQLKDQISLDKVEWSPVD